MNINSTLAHEFKLAPEQVRTVIRLIDGGATIPFIARYRKEATGGLDDVTLRALDERLAYLNRLESRRAEIIESIDSQGKLSQQLRRDIESATVMQRLEDLYKPFKKKRATRASKARDAGLEPLATEILAQQRTSGNPLSIANKFVSSTPYDTPAGALQGAQDIIAEAIADNADTISFVRHYTRANGSLQVKAAKGKSDAADTYETYHDFSESLGTLPNHRILAIDRGEKEGALKVSIGVDTETVVDQLHAQTIQGYSIYTDLIKDAVTDGYKRLIAPTVERGLRADLTERAQQAAIGVFAKNTESLLQQRPVRDARIIALDPGYRTGCKVAVLDEYGKLLDHTTVYPTPPRSAIKETKQTLGNFVRTYHINTIVIGNGTASRETEEVVSDFIAEYDAQTASVSNRKDDALNKTGTISCREANATNEATSTSSTTNEQHSADPLRYTIVNEAGASVYSASKLATEEYPDLDVTTRGAMSLGRRLQDPLAELVKIPPQSIGVGQYQHDLNETALEHSLANVVENVVNRVGVDLNTAGISLLGYVSGISSTVAKNIVAYREEHGAFTDRRQLKQVPKLGAKTFQNCAGFLRISNGGNPLDATGVHPESYTVARKVLKKAQVQPSALASGGIPDISIRIGALSSLAASLNVGLPTLHDIVLELEKPGRDPRDDAPEVVFARTVRSFDDLNVGMKLTGTVRNVVDFGAFVDIGVKQDGLVHISKMADRFVQHPSDIVSVGDTVTVWISAVDKDRGRISLTMVEGK